MKNTPDAPWEEEDLRRFFTLTLEDLRFVATARADTMRLYRALVLVWARVERVLLSEPCSVPAPVVAFVCKQLGLKPDLLVHLPLNSSSARTTTYEAVRTYLQVRPWTAEDAEALRTHLNAAVAQTGNSAALLNAADDWIAHLEVLRPAGETTIERLVYEVQYAAEEALYEYITHQLTEDHFARLDALCHTGGMPSLLVQLAAPPRRASAEAIKQECAHLETIRAALPTSLNWGAITRNRQRQWAAVIKRLRTQEVRHYPAAKRYTLLCAFLVVRAEEITNVIIEMFDELVGKIFARSDADLEQARLAQSQAYQESARLFRKVAQVLLDTEIPPEQVREEIFKRVPRGRNSALVDQSLALEQAETITFFALLEKRWPHLREFAPRVLETLSFGSPRTTNATLEAVQILAEMNHKGQRTLPEEAPLAFIPRKWEKVVQTSAGVDKHAWEWCLVHEMRTALRAGDLSVEGSRRYAAWDSDLSTAEAWQKRRTSWYQEMELPEDGATYARAALADLHQHTIGVGRRLARNTAVRIEKDKIVLTALEQVELPKEAEEARREMLALFPHPGLPDLLMEVDRWAHFTEVFFHLTSRRPPTPEQLAQLRPALFAVFVAEATNLSFATMAHASGISEDQLGRINDWYVREETLRQSITTLITYHRALPLTFKFGTGTTSSPDGIRFGIAASALNARHNPRYFGVKRGVTLYNHTSDQSQNRWIDVVNCLMRDANYVLDGLLYQDALPIEEHYTDTAGYTDLVFGLFQVLGFRFAPRLRDQPDQVLYRAEKGDLYGALNPVLQKSIRETLIATHWDDINRLAASLKDGLVVPSLIISKLQAMQRHNPLQQALQEIGRIGKTKHILSYYIDDERLRRRVLVGLNKGELLHAMARAIFFGRQGRFPDRGYEAQLSRATALSLVLNAIVVWNTRYLAAAATALREREDPLLIEDATWKHLSPILWEHVHLVGSYQFSEPQIEGELRPLRTIPLVGKIKAPVLKSMPTEGEKRPGTEQGHTEAPASDAQAAVPPLVQLALLASEEGEAVPLPSMQPEPEGGR